MNNPQIGAASRRESLVELLADHVLAAGLPSASLRPLAAAAGTSDRMLLYYFADKNELLTATLACIAGRLRQLLDQALPTPLPPERLFPRVCAWMTAPEVLPYIRLWFELIARAGRGEEPFLTIAGQLADGFLAWTESRLAVTRERDRKAEAARLFAAVEGTLLLYLIDRPAVAALAQKPRRIAP